MSTVMSSISDFIEEELQYVRLELEPKVDPFFSQMINTSEGVEQRGVGTDFEVDHIFSTGVSGYIEDDSPMGDATVEVGQGVVFTPPVGTAGKWDLTAGKERTFPTVGEMAHQGALKKTLKLVQGRGGFALPLQYFIGDTLSTTIKKLVASEIRAVARMISQHEANTFYVKDQVNRWLCTCPKGGCTPNDGSAAAFTVNLGTTGATGRIRRFFPGMPVLLYLDTVHLNNNVPIMVSSVDYVGKTLTVASMDGTTTIGNVAGGTTLQIASMSGTGTQYGTTRRWGPSGIYYWLDDDSANLYGINQTTHPQFKSIINTNLGTVLDEPTLNKYLAGFFEAYEGIWDLDGFLTTKGVINAYFEAAAGLQRYERLGKRLKLAEGWTQLDLEYDGAVFQFATSSYLDSGEFIVYKFNDNIRRYGVPALPQGTKQPDFNDLIFLGPWFGSSTIFTPALAGGRKTEFVDAMFYLIRERCPESLPGILLQGVEELSL